LIKNKATHCHRDNAIINLLAHNTASKTIAELFLRAELFLLATSNHFLVVILAGTSCIA